MADKKVDIDILVNTASSAKSVGELRKAMKDLSFAQEEVDKSSPDFAKLTGAINETEGRIGDLNDAFKTFAGSGMERLNTSTGLLKESFASLDLDKFKVGMQGLKALPKALSGEIGTLAKTLSSTNLNFKTLGGSMKGLADSGVGALTKSIIQLGKAILTNPLLLLAAVIVGIVVVVAKFYDKIKPVKAIVEAVGKAIDFVIQKLKDFADWLGITSFAAEEAANKQLESSKKLQKDLTKRYDNEIKLASAAGKNTVKMEKEKQVAVRAAIKEQINALIKLQQINGTFTDEQIKQLDELKEAYQDSLIETKLIDAKTSKETADKEAKDLDDRKKKYEEYAKARAAANADLTKKIEDQNVELIVNDEEREFAKLTLENERAKQSINNSKASEEVKAQALLTQQETFEQGIGDINNKYADLRTKKEKEEAEKRAVADEKEMKDLLDNKLAVAQLAEMQDKNSFEKHVAVLQAQKDIELANAKDSAEKRALIEQKFQNDVDALRQQMADKEKERQKQNAATAQAVGQGVITIMNDIAALDAQNKENQIKSNNEAAESAISSNNAAKDAELSKEGLTADDKAKIQYNYAMKEYAIKLKQYNDNMVIKKKEFDNNKKMAIASALISGALGVVNALSATPFMPMAIIGMALATITTGLSIAKIASQKFDGGGSPPTPPTMASAASAGGLSGGNGGSAQSQFMAPQFFGLGQGGPGGAATPQKVIVTETDITKVQKNVQKIETRATQTL